MAFSPAAWQLSSAAAGTKPATVNPHSRMRLRYARSFGGPSHAITGKNASGFGAADGGASAAGAADTMRHDTRAASAEKRRTFARCDIVRRRYGPARRQS